MQLSVPRAVLDHVRPSKFAPALAAALSGLIVGILGTLIVTGTVNNGPSRPSPAATLPPAVSSPDAQLYTRVRRLVIHQLGDAYPYQRQGRHVELRIVPVAGGPGGHPLPTDLASYRSIQVEYRLNDHPLGKVWRVREAKGEVFLVMRALYTSRFPVYSVHLVGDFPLDRRNRATVQHALNVYMDHATALHLPWARWTRADEGALWTALPRKRIDPRFG